MVSDAEILERIEDQLGGAMMDIDELIARGAPLSHNLLSFTDDLEWQLEQRESWLK